MDTIRELKSQRVSMLLVEQNAEMASSSRPPSTSSTTARWCSKARPKSCGENVQGDDDLISRRRLTRPYLS